MTKLAFVLFGAIITASAFGQATFAGDPVKSFESFVAAATRHSDGAAWTFEHRTTKKMTHVVASVRDVRYDVRKTDSLVTPIVGEVKFVLRMRYAVGDSPQPVYTFVEDTTVRYVWRGGKWAPVEAVRTQWGEAPSGTSYATKTTAAVSQEEMAAPNPAQAPGFALADFRPVHSQTKWRTGFTGALTMWHAPGR